MKLADGKLCFLFKYLHSDIDININGCQTIRRSASMLD